MTPLLQLLAQQAPAPGDPATATDLAHKGALTIWDSFSAWIGEQYDVRPPLSVVIFLGLLLVITFVIERVSMGVVRRLTSKTETKVDDVFVEGIPGIVRTICITLALRVVAVVFMHESRQQGMLTALHGITVAIVSILVARLLLKMVSAWIDSKPAMRPVGPGIKLAIKVLLIPIIILSILHAIGIEIQAALAALGIGALAVGLALQDVLKNIFAGVQLVLDQPVRAGDYIQLANGTKGTVTEMGLRSTKLLTLENNTVIIPNTTLANEVITNTDLVDRAYTHTVNIGVAYGVDTRRVEAILLEEANAVAASAQGFLKEGAAVAFTAFGDSALNFRITVRLAKFSGSIPAMSELNHRIYARLSREGIEIPYPMRTVIVRREAAAGEGERTA